MKKNEFILLGEKHEIPEPKPLLNFPANVCSTKLFLFQDSTLVETWDSWRHSMHSEEMRKYTFCIDMYCSPGERDYYIATITDLHGVIPETEENCSWVGSSYVSAQEALDEAFSKFQKTVELIEKIKNALQIKMEPNK